MNYGFVDIYRDIPVDAVLEANSARKGKGKIPLDRLVDMLKVEFDVKGSATVAEISAMTGMQTGDTWAVSDSGTLPSGLALTAGDLVMWAGDTWSRIFHLDLTGYATVEQLNAAVAALTAAINDAVATEKAQREDADAALQNAIDTHAGRTDNPHNVTAEQIGAVDAGYVDAHVLKIAPPEAAGAGEVIFYRGRLLL